MKEFITAVRELEEADEDGQKFEIKETDATGEVVRVVDCFCYKPTDGQLAVLIASVSRSQDWKQQVAGIINFFVEVLDEDSHAYIVGRLMDRSDPFGLDDVKAIMEWMVEDWTGRPTQPPSGSTQSRQSGGRKSTRPTRKATSSALAPAGS